MPPNCTPVQGLCYGMLFISTIKGIERREQIEKINTPDALWFGKTEAMGNPFSYPRGVYRRWHGLGGGRVSGKCQEVAVGTGCLCVCVSRCLGIWRSPPYHQEIEGAFSKLDCRGSSLPGPRQTPGFKSSLHHQLVLCLVPWPQVSGDN